LNSTVLPVIVYTLAPGVKTEAMRTLPLFASVRAPLLLLVSLLYPNAGVVCDPAPLKLIVLRVIV
jgi:hypothetical protein